MQVWSHWAWYSLLYERDHVMGPASTGLFIIRWPYLSKLLTVSILLPTSPTVRNGFIDETGRHTHRIYEFTYLISIRSPYSVPGAMLMVNKTTSVCVPLVHASVEVPESWHHLEILHSLHHLCPDTRPWGYYYGLFCFVSIVSSLGYQPYQQALYSSFIIPYNGRRERGSIIKNKGKPLYLQIVHPCTNFSLQILQRWPAIWPVTKGKSMLSWIWKP